MAKLLRKTILFGISYVRTSPGTSNLGFLPNPEIFSLRLFSSGSNQQSFTVSYLINELGLSSQAALSVSKRVNFESSEKPDKVINLFKKYTFTPTQIATIVRRNPQVILMDTEKILLPKLEFFGDKGVSWDQFSKSLSVYPTVLGCSLDKKIVPSYEFLRNFLQSDEKAIAAVAKYPDMLILNIEKYVAANIDVLQEHGVPHSNIAQLIVSHPRTLTPRSDRFQKTVEEAVKMGLNPKRSKFIRAILVLCGLRKSTWESKINAYKKWGWSEDVVLKAFERHPMSMLLSEDKITAGMTFFINEMGLRPCFIAKQPVILSLSLKQRVIPRFSVFQALVSKDLVKQEAGLRIHQLFMVPENKFLQKFVLCHQKEAPELLKLYKEKLDLSKKPEI